MRVRIVGWVLMSVVLCQSGAMAKTWYEKGCTIRGKDKSDNVYVGGAYNKSHLHIGTDFLSIYSKNNESKPVTAGKANCASINQAITDVGGGGFAYPAEVTTCLAAACSEYCTWDGQAQTCR